MMMLSSNFSTSLYAISKRTEENSHHTGGKHSINSKYISPDDLTELSEHYILHYVMLLHRVSDRLCGVPGRRR